MSKQLLPKYRTIIDLAKHGVYIWVEVSFYIRKVKWVSLK